MTYTELNIYLEDVECQKALLMLEAVNEMDSDVYMESGDGLIKKVIDRLKKLFESIRDWFSKHFRRNNSKKNVIIKISKSEHKKIENELKFSQKLKQAVKNPKNWKILISVATMIGFGKLVKENRKLKKQVETETVNSDQLYKNLIKTKDNLEEAKAKIIELISDNTTKSIKLAMKDKEIKNLKEDKNKYKDLLASHAENEAKLAKQMDEFQQVVSITEQAGVSNMQHAQKLEAKVEKEKVEDSIKEEPKKIDKTSINAGNGTKKVKKYKLQRGKKLAEDVLYHYSPDGIPLEKGSGIIRSIPKSSNIQTVKNKNNKKIAKYDSISKVRMINPHPTSFSDVLNPPIKNKQGIPTKYVTFKNEE